MVNKSDLNGNKTEADLLYEVKNIIFFEFADVKAMLREQENPFIAPIARNFKL